MNRTELIQLFLETEAVSELAALYDPGMEVQVNVYPQGEPVEETTKSGHTWRGWRTKHGYVIKHFRIPWGAWTDKPTYKDSPLGFPIEDHVQAIGLTGWCYDPAESRFFVYDFDSLIGHSQGLKEDQLKEIQGRLMQLPWVTIRKSKSGKGLHVYVFLEDPEPTKNHNEHAALARAILVQMSQEAEFDFNASVDVCGGNAWIYHAEMKQGGFESVKEATSFIESPKDWRDHLNLLRKQQRRRPKPEGVADDFYKVSGSQPPQKLDQEHKKLIEYLESIGAFYYWQPENNCLVTHTYSLKQAHEDLQLRGPYDTVATGRDFRQDKNCYAFPIPDGAWTVRRFSKGVAETADWDEDSSGWTRCRFNYEPKIKELVDKMLPKDFDKPNVYIADYDDMVKLNARLGKEAIDVPEAFVDKEFTIKVDRKGVNIRVKKQGDTVVPEGWRDGHGVFKKQITEEDDHDRTMINILGDMDDEIRMVLPPYSDSDATAKFYGRNHDSSWNRLDKDTASSRLRARYGGNIDVRKDALSQHPWRRVFMPFKSEYPGNRQWNLDPVTYACDPVEGPFPTWDKLYDQLGRNLTIDLEENPWALEHGIKLGRQYLQLWVASVLQTPEYKLPFLFFFGENKGGKSLFHECLRYLIGNHGVVDASNALGSDHNAEIAKSVICTCDEIDLTKKKGDAYSRIKRWVTGTHVTINQKYLSAYEVDNYNHFIQCNNRPDTCPIFAGDTRITVIKVEGIPDDVQIPKNQMEKDLEAEAPHFLHYLLNLQIPPCRDRLRIPCIGSAYKDEVMEQNETVVQTFLRERTVSSPGAFIMVDDFIEKLSEEKGFNVEPGALIKQFRSEVLRGRMGRQGNAIANYRWKTDPEPEDKTPWYRKGRYLIRNEEK